MQAMPQKRFTVVILIALLCVAPLGIMAILHAYYSHKAVSVAYKHGKSFRPNGPVYTVRIHDPGSARIVIPYLPYMLELNHLMIGGVELTDEQFETVVSLDQVEWLSIREVDNDDLRFFTEMRNLKKLDLSFNDITGESLLNLGDLPELEHLYLSNSNISGSGLASLAKFPKLRKLDLVRTPVDDESIPYLLQLKKIRSLSLDQTQITPEGGMQLADLYWIYGIALPHWYDYKTEEGKAALEAFRLEFRRRHIAAYERALANGEEVPEDYRTPFKDTARHAQP